MIKQLNYPLLKHNTFGIDVLAEQFIQYDSVKELKSLFSEEEWENRSWYHIGAGSNILFCQDFEGTILFSGINDLQVEEEFEESVLVSVGAGYTWDDFVDYAVKQGWGGCENLSLIPGQVGAAAIQNIGAYGAEVKDIIEWVEVFDTQHKEVKQITVADCEYDYRYSAFKDKWAGKYIITRVVFRLAKQPVFNLGYGDLRKRLKEKGEEVTLADVRRTVIEIRNEKLPDPAVLGNAGSFFQNPYILKTHYEELKEEYPDMPCYEVNESVVKIPAAWLIEKCGLKGMRIGDAMVYEKQPLVIVNTGNATPEDIMTLADSVYNEVANTFKIGLSEEVIYIA